MNGSNGMCARSLDKEAPAPMSSFAQARFWPVYAISGHSVSKVRVRSDQKQTVFLFAVRGEPRRDVEAVLCAKMAIDHAGALGQGGNDIEWVGYALRVCEKERWGQISRKVTTNVPYRGAPLAGGGGLVFQPHHEP